MNALVYNDCIIRIVECIFKSFWNITSWQSIKTSNYYYHQPYLLISRCCENTEQAVPCTADPHDPVSYFSVEGRLYSPSNKRHIEGRRS